MRQRGKAAVTVCSSAFIKLGRAQASAFKAPELPIAEVAHPFGALSRAAVRAEAERCAAQIAAFMDGSVDGSVDASAAGSPGA